MLWLCTFQMGLIIYMSLHLRFLMRLQKSWVCRLILKTTPSCPGLTPTHHLTISLTAGSVERSPLHQWKASHGGHLHFKEKTFSKCVNTFDDNYVLCLFFIWWPLPTLKWTGATLCTLTMDITWLLILIIHCLGLMTISLHIRQMGLDLMVFTWPLSNMGWDYMVNSWKRTSSIYCPYMLGTNRVIPKSQANNFITMIGNNWDFDLRNYAT